MGGKSSKPSKGSSAAQDQDLPLQNYPPLNPKLIAQLSQRYIPVYLPAQVTGERQVQLINGKGKILPEGMQGFEKVFKNRRQQQNKPKHEKKDANPNLKAMEDELKRLKEESFAMKCKLKAADGLYTREFQICENLKDRLEEQKAPPPKFQPKNIK